MYYNNYEITDDEFGVHTFELTIPCITKDEFERIGMNAENSFIKNDRNSICIYPKRRGVKILLNHTDNNFYNIKVIVSPRKLIDEESDAVNILREYDDFNLLGYLLNQSIHECLGEEYNMDSFNLSRLDFCVNIMLSESFSAERYVKLIKRSMKYNDSAEVIKYSDDVTDAADKNKHSFRIRTGNLTFTAYDKYFQLENIGESYDKASEGFLRLEIAVNRDEIRSFEESIQLESDNLNLIYILTCCSENVFKNYIRDHFYRGDYCYIDSMRLLIGISELKKKDKKVMLKYADMQCRKQSFLSAKKEMEKTLSRSRLKKMYRNFELLGIYPISVSFRDKHGQKAIPGLHKILGI